MKLLLVRDMPQPECTLGKLFIDGAFECFTCEDVERPEGQKVHGKTAIPRGTYRVVITRSNRFQRDLPLLLDVPNFEGIRIHPGNTAADTEGCILPGIERLPGRVLRSRDAFAEVFDAVRNAIHAGEPVEIEVTGPRDPAAAADFAS
jgi:hypothetical protein